MRLIAECGATHTGIDSALRLVRASARAGFDAVKFQIFDPDHLCADKEMTFSYTDWSGERIREPLYEILKRRCLTYTQWRRIKAEADAEKIEFYASVDDFPDIDFLLDLGCKTVKIGSGGITHHALIRYAAKYFDDVHLDVGGASLEEIGDALGLLEAEKTTLHYCPEGYPTTDVRIFAINQLRSTFPLRKIAYSDHYPDFSMCIAAVALGCGVIEKTITENRKIVSPEHAMSLETSKLSDFVQTLHGVGEACKWKDFRRAPGIEAIRFGIYAAEDLEPGTILKPGHLAFRRPAVHIEANREITDMVVERTIKAGEPIQFEDLR